jgi:hypothetical protein
MISAVTVAQSADDASSDIVEHLDDDQPEVVRDGTA